MNSRQPSDLLVPVTACLWPGGIRQRSIRRFIPRDPQAQFPSEPSADQKFSRARSAPNWVGPTILFSASTNSAPLWGGGGFPLISELNVWVAVSPRCSRLAVADAFHCIASAFVWSVGYLWASSRLTSCDRTVPVVLLATDEPVFFLRFVLPAHVQ